MLVTVKNARNTSDNKLPSGFESWEDVWLCYSGKEWPRYCSAVGCYERAEVGAHVIICNDYSKVYIVPLCYHHNNDHDAIFTVDDSMLVRIK